MHYSSTVIYIGNVCLYTVVCRLSMGTFPFSLYCLPTTTVIPLSHAHQKRVEPELLTHSHGTLNPGWTRVSKLGWTIDLSMVQTLLTSRVEHEVWIKVGYKCIIDRHPPSLQVPAISFQNEQLLYLTQTALRCRHAVDSCCDLDSRSKRSSLQKQQFYMPPLQMRRGPNHALLWRSLPVYSQGWRPLEPSWSPSSASTASCNTNSSVDVHNVHIALTLQILHIY